MKKQTAEYINKLGNYCGRRDIDTLTQDALYEAYGVYRADVLVLFGGSILQGVDELAKAMKQKLAHTYMIVGGAGHTTNTLRTQMRHIYPEIPCEDHLCEAELFNRCLYHCYGLKADLLECTSTNCGNNITCMLELLKQHHITCHSMILMQDATMQLRMDATLRKYRDDITIINYATYQAEVMIENDNLVYQSEIIGMWDIERYITLLMGEIPRLQDNEEGYGPNGRDFIAHVDIPDEVLHAFDKLKELYGNNIRHADTRFASNKKTFDEGFSQ